MTRWQYIIGGLLSSLPLEDHQAKANECGALGWELVAVIDRQHDAHHYTVYYFKKAVTDLPEGPEPETRPRFNLTFES